jgi:cadmium resistance protein CadD (predicted permease)
MDQKNSQILGCFLGLIFTIIASLAIFQFFEFSMVIEYAIMGILAIIFSGIGIVFARFITRRNIPPSAPPPTPPQPTPTPIQQQNPQHLSK